MLWLSVVVIILLYILYKSEQRDGLDDNRNLYFGDIVIVDDFYGIVLADDGEEFVFGKDTDIYRIPVQEFLSKNKGAIEVRRIKYNLCDNDKRRVLIIALEYLQKYKKKKYGEYRDFPPVVFVQQILIDAGVISYYNGNAFMLEDSQKLYFGAPLDSKTLNKMPLYLTGKPVML